jgi:hypothetical protein
MQALGMAQASGLRYVPYHLLDGRPNVVVDGSPTRGTVLTLTHWPGYPAPAGLARDLSAQMAFAYLDAGGPYPRVDAAAMPEAAAAIRGVEHVPSEHDLRGPYAASNNHFDQDGLVALLALTRPQEALSRRALLEDLAAAGDFATYRDRDAARLSMAIAAYADAERSPLQLEPESNDQDAQLYTELLGLLPEWCDHPARTRALWAEEDAELTRAERLVAGGAVSITERVDADLAVFDVPEASRLAGGHRFAHLCYPGLHPMAVANSTDRFAVLVRHGRRWRLYHRYETWVQYCTRRPHARRDLRPLASALTELEPGGVTWTGSPSGGLEPTLEPAGGESDLDPGVVVDVVAGHLATAPPDWNPYHSR